jgi:acylaminoacyl-peptidase
MPCRRPATTPPSRCWVETLGVGAYDYGSNQPPTAAALAAMHRASPIRHLVPPPGSDRGSVAAPLLLLLGLKDRRVPASQGIEYLHAARAQGVTAR